jgi:two-component system response regulator (stage 0 sporulation protein A)
MADQEKIKIMLVDDDNFLLEMYAKKFDNNGYDTTVCPGPAKCLEELKGGYTPDILVSDLIMPDMDGEALLTKIKEENLVPDSIKIILTNQGQEEDKEKFDGLGVSGYIVKALNTPSEVVEKITEIYKSS